jgi:O-methyltransferase involved in polyketide biosynthesis
MIHLEKEMETLLITLYSKAMMSKTGQIIHDRMAEDAVGRIEYDFKRLDVNEKTQVFMALRSAIIDDFAKGYLSDHPNAAVLHLGCGLDFRYDRLGKPDCAFYDLDYPEVIAIKREFCGETAHYRFIASSVNDLAWLDGVPANDEALVIAEGLTMYLSEEELNRLFAALNGKFREVTYIFDVYSLLSVRLAQKRYNPLLNRTGAEIKWGIDEPERLSRFGLRFIKSLYINDARFVKTIKSAYFRFMFRLTMGVKAANNAMRILVCEKA